MYRNDHMSRMEQNRPALSFYCHNRDPPATATHNSHIFYKIKSGLNLGGIDS